MKSKNTAALVFAILGTIFGAIGALMWTACADCASIGGSSTLYTIGFIAFGIGGAVCAMIGGIQAFSFKSGSFGLSLFGMLFQIGNLVLQIVFAESFSFILSLWTILAILMGLLQTIFVKRNG